MDYAVAHGIDLFDAAELYPIPPKPETQDRGHYRHLVASHRAATRRLSPPKWPAAARPSPGCAGMAPCPAKHARKSGKQRKTDIGAGLTLPEEVLRDIEMLHTACPNPCP
jgi:hypothetical protein